MGTTLWTLPAQPAPKSDVKSSTFVTIWAFVCLVFVGLFHRKLRGPKPTWSEFKHVRNATLLLAIWYTFTAADRWMHYEQRVLPFGYVLFEPILKIVLIASTIWYLWATYKIIWRELKLHFDPRKAQKYWWLAAKLTIFLVGLVSFYYVVLHIAVAVVWLEFLSLNVIDDTASKRNGFELAMTTFFAVFGLLTVIAAIAAVIIKARSRKGRWERDRVFLVVATIMLLARSLAECAIAFLVQTPRMLRSDARLALDIAFGLLTSFYLVSMYLQALRVGSDDDSGHPDVDKVQSDIRTYILDKIRRETHNNRDQPPSFKLILTQVRDELGDVLDRGPLSTNSSMGQSKKVAAATRYLDWLGKRFGHFGPRPVVDSQPAHLQRLSKGPKPRSGRHSAPIKSSGAFQKLVTQSNPQMRSVASDSNVGRSAQPSRFAPRPEDSQTDFGAFGGSWQPEVPPVHENPTDYDNVPSRGPPTRFMPPDMNQPSFQARAAQGGLMEERRSASDPIVPPEHGRRRYQPNVPAQQGGQGPARTFSSIIAPQTTPQYSGNFPQQTPPDPLSPSRPGGYAESSAQGSPQGRPYQVARPGRYPESFTQESPQVFPQSPPQAFAQSPPPERPYNATRPSGSTDYMSANTTLHPSQSFERTPSQHSGYSYTQHPSYHPTYSPDIASSSRSPVASSRSPVNWNYELANLDATSSQMSRPDAGGRPDGENRHYRSVSGGPPA